MKWFNGQIMLNDGNRVRAHLHEECVPIGICICGFCKGDGQCEWGDCHNPLPTTGVVGTLCRMHSEWGYGRFAGHKASAEPDN